MSSYHFLVNRADLAETRIETVQTPSAGPGEVVLRVEGFALTANNITYGVAGDLIGYWQFFPAPPGRGRIPVWGIGRVAASEHPEVRVGDRYYGYFPMSTLLKVKAGKVTSRGLVDEVAHRAPLPPVYNQYSLMTPDNGFDPAFDNHAMVYRPLFTTSFVLDDWLADNAFFAADNIVLSSASSKTAFGLAFMLKRRAERPRVIALTSGRNAGFVQGLDLYDEIVTYEEVERLDAKGKSVYVDMAGNRDVLARVHRHLGDQLVNSSGVGATHWEAREGEAPSTLPGAKPTMFFAPTQIQKRNREWGPQLYTERVAAATADFFARVDDWVTIEEHPFAEIDGVYRSVLQGASPERGFVVAL